MQAKIIKNAPKTRCYKCGTTETLNICHHCGKPMCMKHTFRASADDNKKLLSTEFTKLNLEECGEEAYHCSNCIHLVKDQDWKAILVGIILIFISLIAIPNNRIAIKIIGIVGGGVGVAYGFYTNKQRKTKFLASKPELPVLPRFNRIHIKEELRGNINLSSEGNYSVTVDPAIGNLDIDISLTHLDYERLEKYHKKYGTAEKFHAGFVVLEGAAGIQFSDSITPNQDSVNHNTTVISLIDRVSNQPLLKGIDKRDAGKITKCLPYDLLDIPNQDYFPVQLVLSFLPRTDRRGIEIGIQWTDPNFTNPDTELWKELWNLEIDQIEILELKFPVAWGRVEKLSSSDNAVISSVSQSITWRRVKPSKQDLLQHRCTLQVEFENQINPLDSSVSGKAKVLFQGTLSGLENVKVYFPTGKPGRLLQKNKSYLRNQIGQEELILNTGVYVDFELSLTNIRYQHIREVPEPNKKERDRNKQEEIIFEGVLPNYETIILITDKISESEQNFYVNRVIENKPIFNAQENILNRVWTIFGRFYEGIYPVEFQLDLRGYESNNLNLQAPLGITMIKRTVKGTYSNPEMEQHIENVWEKLDFLIREILEPLSEQKNYLQPEALPPSLDETTTSTIEAKFEDESN